MIVTLTGANSFALQNAQRELTTTFIASEGDMALERLDASEATIERINEALQSLPFLSNKKMVLLRQGSLNKQFLDRAQDLLPSVPDTTDVILVEPKLDKRSGYYKFLKSHTDFRELMELDQQGLVRWLVRTAKDQNGEISPADAGYLINRVGMSQQLLSSELDKLLLYAPRISRDGIDALTEPNPQSTVFELLEAAFAGRRALLLRLYIEQRALKVEPQQIIAMLAWQLHILVLIKTAGQRSPQAIAGEAKVSPYVVKKSLTIAHGLTLGELKHFITDLAELDGRSKRQTLNVDDALQYYLLTLSK